MFDKTIEDQYENVLLLMKELSKVSRDFINNINRMEEE